MDCLKKLLESVDGKTYEVQWRAYTSFIWDFTQKLLEQKGRSQKSLKKKFMSLKTMSEKLQLIEKDEQFTGEIESMFTAITKNASRSKQKSEDEAKIALIEGKRLLEQSMNYEQALEQFSKVIDNSTFSSEMFYEAIKLRGICLYECKGYSDAHKDFITAVELMNSKKDLAVILMKIKCLRKMGKDAEANESLNEVEKFVSSLKHISVETKRKLINEFREVVSEKVDELCKDLYEDIPLITENPKTPGHVNALQICTDDIKGRFLRTSLDIKKGSIVISEDATAFWVAPCRYNECCNFCMKPIEKSFISCRVCTAVKYCSLVCENKAWAEFHKVECAHLDVLKYFSKSLMSLRIILKFGFEKILKETKEEKVPLSYFCEQGFSHTYESMQSLFGDGKHMSADLYISYCISAILLTRAAEHMKLINRNSPHYFTFATTVLKHTFQIIINSFAVTDVKLRRFPNHNIYVNHGHYEKNGIALYLGASLPSHCCDYNCNKYTIGKRLILVTNRDIKAGEEITITYWSSYKKMAFKDRQTYLKDHYRFDCKCKACDGRWENVEYAYRCPSCSAAFIFNNDMTAYCVQCGYNKSSVIQNLVEESKRAENLVENAKYFLHEGKMSEAKRNLDKAFTIVKEIKYSVVGQLEVHYQLSKYYLTTSDYSNAFHHLQCLVTVQQKLVGEDSLEAVAYLLKAVSCLVYDSNGTLFCRSIRLNKASEMFNTALSIMDKYKTIEFTVVAKVFADSFELIPELRQTLKTTN